MCASILRICFMIVSLTCAVQTFAKPVAKDLLQSDGQTLNLPPEVQSAIGRHNADQKKGLGFEGEKLPHFNFEAYKRGDFMETVQDLFKGRPDESPMGIRGDFNGDGIVDYILYGHADVSKNKDKDIYNFFYAVLSNKQSGQHKVIHVFSKPDEKDDHVYPPTVDETGLSEEAVEERSAKSEEGLYTYLQKVCAESHKNDKGCGPKIPKRCQDKNRDGVYLNTFGGGLNKFLCYETDPDGGPDVFVDQDEDDDGSSAVLNAIQNESRQDSRVSPAKAKK